MRARWHAFVPVTVTKCVYFIAHKQQHLIILWSVDPPPVKSATGCQSIALHRSIWLCGQSMQNTSQATTLITPLLQVAARAAESDQNCTSAKRQGIELYNFGYSHSLSLTLCAYLIVRIIYGWMHWWSHVYICLFIEWQISIHQSIYPWSIHPSIHL